MPGARCDGLWRQRTSPQKAATAHWQAVTPLRNPLGGADNCVACAIAGDSRLAGNAASALRTDPQLISVLEDTFGSSCQSVSNKAEISSILENAGPGARGIVFGDRGAGEVGHVLNVVNQGGSIRFIDFQSGSEADLSGYKGFEFLQTAGGG